MYWFEGGGTIHDEVEFVNNKVFQDKIINENTELTYKVQLEKIKIRYSNFNDDKNEKPTKFWYLLRFTNGEFKDKYYSFELGFTSPMNQDLLKQISKITGKELLKKDIQEMLKTFQISGNEKEIFESEKPYFELQIFHRKNKDGTPWNYGDSKVLGYRILDTFEEAKTPKVTAMKSNDEESKIEVKENDKDLDKTFDLDDLIKEAKKEQ